MLQVSQINDMKYCELQLLTRELLSNLALVCYHANDIEQSLLHQEKATIICERVVGLDHYETAHAYGNLGLFYHSIGRTKDALNFLERALYLCYLAGGEHHSDNGDTYVRQRINSAFLTAVFFATLQYTDEYGDDVPRFGSYSKSN
jgi:tetratricopeptide (TPR) repeat protein